MRAGLLAVLAVAVVALAGCSSAPPPSQPPASTGACQPGPADTQPLPAGNPVVAMRTTKGEIKLQLFMDKAPVTAGNFLNLTKQGYYDCNRFHRVIPNFMIQDGDPNSKDPAKKDMWGTGGPDYTIPDEYHPDLRHDAAGMLSMANRGPNTGSSQFFITLVPTPHLDAYDQDGERKPCGQPRVSCHAVFGRVVEGMGVVQSIGNVPTDARDRPVEDVVIERVSIVRSG